MASGLVVAAFNSEANTSYFGPIIVAMVLLALGLSSISAPATEAVMGSVPDEQRGAAAGVNNTTRELGGTLGVAVFGSIFASAYAPKIIAAFRPLPIPAGPKTEAHQSMAAALAVVKRAPHSVQPLLQQVAFDAFHDGLRTACLAGAVVAALGALGAWMLLPGRYAPWTLQLPPPPPPPPPLPPPDHDPTPARPAQRASRRCPGGLAPCRPERSQRGHELARRAPAWIS